MKIKSLTLVYRDAIGNPDYRVDKVADTVEYHPNQVLQKNEVEMLCSAKDWKITIIGTKPQ